MLGLIFLKYISDKFEQKHEELVAEGEGFEEDRDEYAAEGIFFVPKSARWETVAAAAHTPEIGKVIDEAMRQIEADNDKLKNVLPKNFARQELDKRRLGEVVDLFTNVQMAEKGDTRDILGRTYEYCLAKFAEAEGKNAGEFYTPACIVRTLVEIIEPYHGACTTRAVARRHVRAVGRIRAPPFRQHQRPVHLRAGEQPHHLEDGHDEPGHPAVSTPTWAHTTTTRSSTICTRTNASTSSWPTRHST